MVILGKCNTCTSLKSDQNNIPNAAGSIVENETSLPWPCYSSGTERQVDLMADTKLEACS